METFILIVIISAFIGCFIYVAYVITFYGYCKNCGHVKGKIHTMTYTTKSDKWINPDYGLCEKCYCKRKHSYEP